MENCPNIKTEMTRFQDGTARVAIISDAASTGISLHCSKNRDVKNKDPRHHILLEFPWSADKAIQQLGRTNRSNQCYPPNYLIVSTDIPGEYRFSCAVAARVKTMGATTYGDPSFMNHLHLKEFDFFNIHGEQALSLAFEKMRQNSGLRTAFNRVGVDISKKDTLERTFNR